MVAAGNTWSSASLACALVQVLLHSVVLPVTSKASLPAPFWPKEALVSPCKVSTPPLVLLERQECQGRNAFVNLSPCFYHSSEPVTYSTLLRHKSGQAQDQSSYLPALHHCTSMVCAAASNSLGNANITIFFGGMGFKR